MVSGATEAWMCRARVETQSDNIPNLTLSRAENDMHHSWRKAMAATIIVYSQSASIATLVFLVTFVFDLEHKCNVAVYLPSTIL
jgi:hypothetical protein